MKRREAIALVLGGTMAQIHRQDAFMAHTTTDGATVNEKGEWVNAKTNSVIDTEPPKELTYDFGDHFEQVTFLWKGKKKTVSMQDVWDAI